MFADVLHTLRFVSLLIFSAACFEDSEEKVVTTLECMVMVCLFQMVCLGCVF